MPLQNRVDPFGSFIATSARGAFMGNRGGALHNDHQQLTVRRWTSNRWIICQLEFKGRKRPLMSPGCYTELFFYDEATALAAGHRPCWECRRDDFKSFKAAWLKGNPQYGFADDVKIDEIDRILQRERISSAGQKETFEAYLDGLPDGVMIMLPDNTEAAGLVWQGKVYPWSFTGYGTPVSLSGSIKVRVLTPASTVNAIRAGFLPNVCINVEGQPVP